MSDDRPVTGPDLTPEERAFDLVCEEASAPLARKVARLVADARAEGDRQGAARVTAAVEALVDPVAGAAHRLYDERYFREQDIRAALARAATPTDQP